MINVRNLVKYYGPFLAVNDISFDVEPGRIVGFLGPNGAGKSTTIRMLTCFMPATSGSATINGFDVFKESLKVRQCIGYLPEGNPLYPELRVEQQLHYFGKLQGMDKASRKQRIGVLTERCGLEQIINRPIGHLSKGNRQRVGIAQAMLHDPPVLILDEPTSGLDPAQITAVRNLIKSLGKEKTILLSTHILPEVEKTCDDVIIIAKGQVVAEGTPSELTAKVQSTSRVILEVKGAAEEIQSTLEGLARVGKVSIDKVDGWCHTAVTAKQAGDDIREILGDTVTEKRWPLRLMTFENASLEEYFIKITSGEGASSGAA